LALFHVENDYSKSKITISWNFELTPPIYASTSTSDLNAEDLTLEPLTFDDDKGTEAEFGLSSNRRGPVE